MKQVVAIVLSLLASAFASVAAAQPVTAYAIVIGANQGGQGQKTLEFAERDAQRMAQLLPELAHARREHVQLLRQPTFAELDASLAGLKVTLAAAERRGERAQLFFYYSGHARASALSLGAEEYPLAKLRSVLTGLPSTLTVVVLDACQSGAFSNVKGASPAADFSSSSIAGLAVEGVAVMASSTGSELSQESRQLAGSYFTTHFIAALRGAADHNRDGRVSLDEAYRYSYDRTLSDTSRTAVGGQHVTLETELKGRGDVPLSYPTEAGAQLVLPKKMVARVLVLRADNRAVMAEAVKAGGAPLSLGFPDGKYDVIVREDSDAYGCSLELRKGKAAPLDLSRCERIELDNAGAKGERPKFEQWFAEVGLALRWLNPSSYTDTLEQFRFFGEEDREYDGALLGVARLGFAFHPNYSLLARYDEFPASAYERTLAGPDGEESGERFSWTTRAVTLGVRARYPLLNEWFAFYGEGTLGLAFARSEMRGDGFRDKQTDFGLAMNASVGAVAMVWRPYLGTFVEGGYSYAKALDNLVGQSHDDGGFMFTMGLRLRGIGRGW